MDVYGELDKTDKRYIIKPRVSIENFKKWPMAKGGFREKTIQISCYPSCLFLLRDICCKCTARSKRWRTTLSNPGASKPRFDSANRFRPTRIFLGPQFGKDISPSETRTESDNASRAEYADTTLWCL